MPIGFFESKTESARFDKCPEFQTLKAILHELDAKDVELKSASDKNGNASEDHAKYVLIDNLKNGINEVIRNFNRGNSALTYRHKKDMLQLVISMDEAIAKAFMPHGKKEEFDKNGSVLEKPRDNRRKWLSYGVHYGIVGGAMTAALVAPLSIPATLATFFGSNATANMLGYSTGLYDLTPKSVRIVLGLVDELSKLETKLTTAIKSNDPNFRPPVNPLRDTMQRFKPAM